MKSILTIFALLAGLSTAHAEDRGVCVSIIHLNNDTALTVRGIESSGKLLVRATNLPRSMTGQGGFLISDVNGQKTHEVLLVGQEIKQGKLVSSTYETRVIGSDKTMKFQLFTATSYRLPDFNNMEKSLADVPTDTPADVIRVECYRQ